MTKQLRSRTTCSDGRLILSVRTGYDQLREIFRHEAPQANDEMTVSAGFYEAAIKAGWKSNTDYQVAIWSNRDPIFKKPRTEDEANGEVEVRVTTGRICAVVKKLGYVRPPTSLAFYLPWEQITNRFGKDPTVVIPHPLRQGNLKGIKLEELADEGVRKKVAESDFQVVLTLTSSSGSKPLIDVDDGQMGAVWPDGTLFAFVLKD